LIDKVNSGGNYPNSLTVYGDWLYVLNAGGDGTIAGFTISRSNSTRPTICWSSKRLAKGRSR
jgi:hypothetical protein